MVRAFTAAAMALLVSACAPERAPANHRTWRMTLEPTFANSCAPQLDGGLNVETWVPTSGTEFIRFIDAPTVELGRAGPFKFPDGLRGASSQFGWSRRTDFSGAGQQGQLQQTFGLTFSQGDAGVEGVLTVRSQYACNAFCQTPRYTSCDTSVPVKLTEVDLVEFPFEAAVPTEVDKTMLTVAVSLGGCDDDPRFFTSGSEVRFERWAVSDRHVRVPTRTGFYGVFIDSKFGGSLDRVGDAWVWASELSTRARPRGTVALKAFDVSDGDWFESTLDVEVASDCTMPNCPARACRTSARVTAMREEKKR